MHVTFALFADAANLSQEGKLNILGVFDAVQVGALPTVHRRASLVVHLKGDESDAGAHSLTLRWLSPTGEELWNTHGQVEVQSAPPTGASISSSGVSEPTTAPNSALTSNWVPPTTSSAQLVRISPTAPDAKRIIT